MSLMNNRDTHESRAEKTFRDAFERLKADRPIKVGKGTHVSQNNVAREAGCDPSALKKARYPALVGEIQRWLLEHPEKPRYSQRKTLIGQRNRNRDLRGRIERIGIERDKVCSLLVQADSKILELTLRVAMLEAMLPGNVVVLPSTGTTS